MGESEKIMIAFAKNVTRIINNTKNFRVVLYLYLDLYLFSVGNDSRLTTIIFLDLLIRFS